jgi:hypothetical protein
MFTTTGRHAALLLLSTIVWATPSVAQRYYSDEDVRKMIIEDSMRNYPTCPCPYSYAWNGKQCAGDSAYSKLGRSGPHRRLVNYFNHLKPDDRAGMVWGTLWGHARSDFDSGVPRFWGRHATCPHCRARPSC